MPYFARLGVSHLYASPIAVARPGSLHGYDVIDPTQVNPELGGEAALRSLAAGLRRGPRPDRRHRAQPHGGRHSPMPGGPTCCATAAPAATPASSTSTGGRDKVLLPILGKPGGDAGGGRDRGGQESCATSIACRWRPASAGSLSDVPDASTIASPGGAPPATASTGGASSTSTSWSACAWRKPRPSKPSMPCRFGFMPRALSTACASIMSTALPIRQATAERCASGCGEPAGPISWSRRSCCAARPCRATGAATAPPATTS